MKRILVWDLPVRLFHWILAISFVGAFAIANLVDDESAAFAVHMLLGAVMAFMVVLRLAWGFFGSRWARFGSFVVRPRRLVAYVKDALSGGGRRYTGHNPGSSMATLLMFALILGLAITGVLMGKGGGEAFEEIHELLAWAMMAVIGVHLIGIAWHTLRHRENIARSMIDGRKQAPPADAIPSSRPVAALVFVVLVGLWATGLVRGYDAASGQVTLPLIGQTLQVNGEHEGAGASGAESREEHEEREDYD